MSTILIPLNYYKLYPLRSDLTSLHPPPSPPPPRSGFGNTIKKISLQRPQRGMVSKFNHSFGHFKTYEENVKVNYRALLCWINSHQEQCNNLVYWVVEVFSKISCTTHVSILCPYFWASHYSNACWLIIITQHTYGMQIHSPGFCCNPWRRDRPINTKQRRGDPGLNAGDHKFTNPSVPLTLRMVGPRSQELQNPPSTQMADLPEGWGCGWQQCWCQEGRRRLRLGVWIGRRQGEKSLLASWKCWWWY